MRVVHEGFLMGVSMKRFTAIFLLFTLLFPVKMLSRESDAKDFMRALTSLGKDKKTRSIQKVFVHEGNLSRKIIMHLSDEPIVAYTPESLEETTNRENGLTKMTFFMPFTTVEGQSNKEALEALSGMHTEDYGVSFYPVTKPMEGIKCLVLFNPDKVGFEYKTFESISGEKGVMFQFYHQGKLKAFAEKNKIRRHADAGKQKIILDFGHGGADPGHILDGIAEKDINRQVGRKVVSLLKKKGFKVYLTRKGDETLSLDQRVKRSLKHEDADAFISIHSNAAPRKGAHGIETFQSTLPQFKREFALMKPETEYYVGEYNKLLGEGSSSLASAIQKNIVGAASRFNPDVIDRNVKERSLYVLMGAEVPSVLVEIGFLTHELERALLQDDLYQRDLAEGICKGIEQFLAREVA